MSINVKSLYTKVFGREYDSEVGVLSRLNPTDRHFQTNLTGSDYITSHTSFLFSCPPLIDYALANPKFLIRPMGLLLAANINENKQYIPVNEFGSAYIRSVPGKVSYQISLARLYTNHDSMLYCLYQWLVALMLKYQNRLDKDEPLFTVSGSGGIQGYSFKEDPGFFTPKSGYGYGANDEKAWRKNRSYRHYQNLGSELFDMPTGILCVELDGSYGIINADYWENVKVINKGRSLQEEPAIENVQLTATNIVPATKLWREIKVEFDKLKKDRNIVTI